MNPIVVKIHVTARHVRRLKEKRSWVPRALTLACICLVAGFSPFPAHALQAHSYLTPARNAQPPSGAHQLCKDYAWACSVSTHKKIISNSDFVALNEVNRSVNRRVRQVTDLSQYHVDENWNLPTPRGGDCEDFALLKKLELIRLGFPAQSLLIATALDKNRRGHAVLIVRTNQGDVVLDNVTTRIKNWSETGYIFLRMQNPKAPASWVSLAMVK